MCPSYEVVNDVNIQLSQADGRNGTHVNGVNGHESNGRTETNGGGSRLPSESGTALSSFINAPSTGSQREIICRLFR